MADEETQPTDQQSRMQAYLEFGPTQIAIFASIAPTIEAFAQQHGMSISRQCDRDPLGPFACYFLTPAKGRFIRICAADPFVDRSRFESHFIVDGVPSRGKAQRWHYSPDEGLDSLRRILEEAKLEEAKAAALREPSKRADG